MRGKNYNNRRAEVLLVSVFVLSRLIYFAVGLRFNTSPLEQFWQMADPRLLRTDLWRTIWYLHMQPPGYNLAVGIILKLFPVHYATALWILQMICGLSIALNLLRLMFWMGVPRRLSLVLTILFIVSPATLLYENAAVYDYPMCALLLASTAALIRFLAEPRARSAVAFFGYLAALAMIRNLFHILYLMLIAGIGLYVFARHRRIVLAGAIPALLLVAAVYVKNGILFHRYTASTWDGMQLARITTDQLTPAEASSLIANGTVSKFAAIPTFSPLSVYLPLLRRVPARTGVPVLDDAVTSTGNNNYNALPYLEVHDRYRADALQVFLHKPAAFVRSLESGWFCYFRPASDLPFYFGVEAAPIDRWERTFDAVFYGQIHRTERHDEIKALFFSGHVFSALTYTGVWLVVVLPLLVLWSLVRLLGPSRDGGWTRDRKVMAGYLVLTILVLTFAVNTLSFQENNRYRFPLDPFFLVFLGTAIDSFVRVFRSRQLVPEQLAGARPSVS